MDGLNKISAKEGPVDVYAELSKKQYTSIINGDVSIVIPYGVKMRNEKGSRCLYFTCEDKEIAEVLVDALDDDQINWQEI